MKLGMVMGVKMEMVGLIILLGVMMKGLDKMVKMMDKIIKTRVKMVKMMMISNLIRTNTLLILMNSMSWLDRFNHKLH